MLLFTALISIVTVASVGLLQRRISSRGTVFVEVVGIDVFWDSECTSMVTEIDWGVLEPSDVVSRTIYIRNTGNTAVILSMATENWAPSEAAGFISVTWDAEGSTLAENAIKVVVITLAVSADTPSISSFSLDIVITGGS